MLCFDSETYMYFYVQGLHGLIIIQAYSCISRLIAYLGSLEMQTVTVKLHSNNYYDKQSNLIIIIYKLLECILHDEMIK